MVMPIDTEKSSVVLKFDNGTATMVEALQVHAALQYGVLETPAEIVDAAIFEMFARQFIVRKEIEDTEKGL